MRQPRAADLRAAVLALAVSEGERLAAIVEIVRLVAIGEQQGVCALLGVPRGAPRATHVHARIVQHVERPKDAAARHAVYGADTALAPRASRHFDGLCGRFGPRPLASCGSTAGLALAGARGEIVVVARPLLGRILRLVVLVVLIVIVLAAHVTVLAAAHLVLVSTMARPSAAADAWTAAALAHLDASERAQLVERTPVVV